MNKPIAIVGIGSRFPRATDANAFWDNIEAGETAFTDIPADRWDHRLLYSPNSRDVDKSWTKKGSFIEGWKDFAALHYGIAPRRLEVMDPQQRLLIEATRWAIQDAGYETRAFDRRRTGAFFGVSVSEFKNIAGARIYAMQMAAGDFGASAGDQPLRDAMMELVANVAPMRAFTLPGSLLNMNAASVAQTFDLGGPAYTIDAACASSSVAIHDAIIMLRAGLIDVGIAGGVYLNLSPDNLIAFTKIGAISPTGACRPFDARADGFVQSDAVAVFYLKRLEDALADDDRIHAVILGSGCNNDGRGEGPMTPRVEGQLEALHLAYADAGVSPASIAYFEAHGTATSIGDPAEVTALSTVLEEAGVGRDEPRPIGSVKGNIGHAMSAAGVAGLVKAIKMIERRTLPVQAGFQKPHPKLGLEALPLFVSKESVALEAQEDAPLRVAVSSFGFGGTNSHLILQEPPHRPRGARMERTFELELSAPGGQAERAASAVSADGRAGFAGPGPAASEARSERLGKEPSEAGCSGVARASPETLPEAVLVTAPTRALLSAHLARLADAIELHAARISLADLAYTLNVRRTRERVRAVIGARTAKELIDNLRRAATGAVSKDVQIFDVGEAGAEAAPICLLYPGQGAQKVGILADWRTRFSAFADAFEALAAAADPVLDRPLATYLYPETVTPAAEKALEATDVCQPAMCALGLSVKAVLDASGVDASVSLGHSLGEFAAMASGGALSPRAAVELVARRGQAMRELVLPDPGAMAAVMADARTVADLIAGIDGVVLANFNHPRQVAISGTSKGVSAACKKIEAKKIEVRHLAVSHAFHSPVLESVRPQVEALVAEVEIGDPKHTIASCIAAEAHADAESVRRTMLDHATAPVEFVRGLQQAWAAGARVFVQAGAGAMLTSFARATLGSDATMVTLAPTEGDAGYELIRGLCTLAALGHPVSFEAVYRGEARRVVELPETPLEREAYWIIKDAPQPKPDLAGEFSDGRSIIVAGSDARDAAPAADDSLVALFREQAALLSRHAEIIEAQNRVLSGVEPASVSASPTVRPPVMATELPQAKPAPAKPSAKPTPTLVAKSDVEPRVRAAIAETRADPSAQVFDIVARVSAFPRASIRAEQKLVGELGFDSLMMADLGDALAKAFPERGPLPTSVFSLDTTVEDLARALSSNGPLTAATSALEADADAGADAETRAADAPPEPLKRYRVHPKTRVRSEALTPHDVAGETWLITEDDSDLGRGLAGALEKRGAKVVRVNFFQNGAAAPAKLSLSYVNVWPSSFAEGLPEAVEKSGFSIDGLIHAAGLGVTNAADFVNPVSVLHPLLAKLSVPRIAVLTALGGRLGLEPTPELSRNILQSALTGYAKALARERSGSVVRALDLDPKRIDAEAIVAEILSGDLTAEVGLGQERVVAELVEDEPASGALRPIRGDDVVIITGGAGEIGARIAKHIATKKPKAIVLLGRSRENDQIRALIADLSRDTRAFYASADVTDAGGLITATKSLIDRVGPATIAIHAAGTIEDAPASKKTLESVHRVMNVKVRGLQAVLRTFPKLQDLVLFTSWAGRFGNAGQVDYAAANGLLDHVAVAGIGSTRVVAIAWPPWSSTAMVASIPEPVKKAMRAEGVTFLGDEEGLAAFDAIFEGGLSGIRIVGRSLPAWETRAQHEESFEEKAHPYLADHRLKGRPVVPLASATDLVAFAFAETATATGGLVIENLQLGRGLFGGDRAVVTVSGKYHRDLDRAVVQIRSSAGVAYRCDVRSKPSAELAGVSLEGEKQTPELTLDRFYAEHTFHGPKLRGVQKIRRVTSEGIEGVVARSSIREWMPKSSRTAWTVDPLVLDGSFQLAAYWLQVHHGRVGFPTGFDRLTMVRPFGDKPILCRIRVRDVGAETFAGDVFYTDDAGTAYALLENVRGRFAEVREQAPASADVPKESWDIASFPEIEQLDQRFQMAELMGLRNPYFHVHAGTAKNLSTVDGVEMINFSSYNYLGYSGHPEVVAAAQEAIARYGTSVSASRVASGERPLHRDLEAGIAEHVGVDDSIVYVSGHATNVTTIGHLFDRSDLILHDTLIHDSILQGIYLSGATRRPFPHGDLDALESALSQIRKNYRRVLICAEGIYSMDGDLCELPRLIEIKQRYKALLLVDEAHSIGVLGPSGRGIGHHFPGVDPRDVDLWMGTLSKSFASCGGYIAGSSALIRYLKYTAPGFVYSAGITPPNAAASLKALELMHREPEVVERLRARSRFFLEGAKKRGINTGLAMGAAVVPAIIGNSLECMKLSERLAARRINVQPIVYPAVEDESARLRFFISALHTEEQLTQTLDAIREELAMPALTQLTSTMADS